jgi:hypothetical protein
LEEDSRYTRFLHHPGGLQNLLVSLIVILGIVDLWELSRITNRIIILEFTAKRIPKSVFAVIFKFHLPFSSKGITLTVRPSNF